MSNFLSVLQEQEQKPDHGWSAENRYSQVAEQANIEPLEAQMFTQNTPDSQSMGSLEGWTDSSVVVEEVVQDFDTFTTEHDLTRGVQLDPGGIHSQAESQFSDADNSQSNSHFTNSELASSPSSCGSFLNDGQSGQFKTFNVTVSPDGTLIDPTTGGSLTTLIDSNNLPNITSVQSQGNSNFSILSPNASPVLGTGPTSILPKNSMNGASQSSTNKKVIVIPKIQGGQDAYLSMEQIQSILQGKTELFASEQKYTYNSGSSHRQKYVNNSDQSPMPKLTSLLNANPSLQNSPLKNIHTTQNTLNNALRTPSIVRPQLHGTPQKSIIAVSSSKVQGGSTLQPYGNVVIQAPQPNNPIGQQTIVLQSSGAVLSSQNVLCNSTAKSSVRSITPSGFVRNSVSNQGAEGDVVQQTLDAGNVIMQHGSVASHHVQNPYVTSISTLGAANKTVKIAGSNTVLTGSSAEEIFAAFGKKSGAGSVTNVSSPPNVSLTIVDPVGPKSNVTRLAPALQSVSVGSGRGSNSRGRGTPPKVFIQPIKHVNMGATNPQQSFIVKQGNNIVVTSRSVGENVVYHLGKNAIISTSSASQPAAQLVTMATSLSNSTGLAQTDGNSENSNGGNDNVGNGTSAPDDKCINKKFVTVKGGGELTAGTTYLISGPNGLQKKMVFNGENFVDFISTEQSEATMVGGGKKLKGNATGLNMLRSNYADDVDDKDKTVLPNGRTWKHTEPLYDKSLTRRPLHQQKDQSKDQSSQSTSTGTTTQTEPDKISKEYIAVCKHCGQSSHNLTRCERCSRMFPTDIKLQQVPAVIDKNSFYSNKMTEQASGYKGYTVKHVKDGVSTNIVQITTGRTIRNAGRQHKLVHTRKLPIQQEPVTVILSSDDEEEQESSSNKSETTQNSSKQEATNSEPDELSSLVNVIPLKRPSSPTFNKGSRISRMELQDGQPMRKVRRQNSGDGLAPIRTVSTKTAVINNETGTTEEETIKLDNLYIECRSIRVGSLKGTPVDPVFISQQYIEFNMEAEDDSHSIKIDSDDVVQCLLGRKFHVIFIQTNAEAGVKIRKHLGMTEAVDGKPYFDPMGSDSRHTYITLFLTDSCEITYNQLYAVMKSYKLCESAGNEFLIDLSETDQTKLMCKTAPNYTTKTQEMLEQAIQRNVNSAVSEASESRATTPAQDGEPGEQERSPSPPKFMFSGPVEKLITYPPPPATGGITVTNEDLFCLTDGEFLNDVIIDFYLKYLVNEKLSEHDRKRTHVFSSFFFKRFTQRINKCIDITDTDMTLAEKRHARVKKWTKHVDLFEKDFIIVPINERSHWFLAIICFPGYTEIKKVHYILNEENNETPDQKGDNSQTEAQESQQKEQPSESQDSEMADEKPKEESNNMEESKPVESQNEGSQEEGTGEEPMDTTDNASLTGSDVCSSQEQPKGRFLTEEEVNDPAIVAKARIGKQQPCIMVMDSLAGQSRSRIIQCLKDYLQVEWNCKKSKTGSIKERFKGANLKVPQQTNYSDCGVYVLQYVESFFEDPILDFTFPMKGLAKWFTEERVNKKRKEIHDLVMQLKEKFDIAKQKKS